MASNLGSQKFSSDPACAETFRLSVVSICVSRLKHRTWICVLHCYAENGKTFQDCTAVLHETPLELHFPYENGKNMVQSLKRLKTAWPCYFSFLNVVVLVWFFCCCCCIFTFAYLYICIESNYWQNGKCVTDVHPELSYPMAVGQWVSGDAAGWGLDGCTSCLELYSSFISLLENRSPMFTPEQSWSAADSALCHCLPEGQGLKHCSGGSSMQRGTRKSCRAWVAQAAFGTLVWAALLQPFVIHVYFQCELITSWYLYCSYCALLGIWQVYIKFALQ